MLPLLPPWQEKGGVHCVVPWVGGQPDSSLLLLVDLLPLPNRLSTRGVGWWACSTVQTCKLAFLERREEAGRLVVFQEELPLPDLLLLFRRKERRDFWWLAFEAGCGDLQLTCAGWCADLPASLCLHRRLSPCWWWLFYLL